jgi:hypothetical protein
MRVHRGAVRPGCHFDSCYPAETELHSLSAECEIRSMAFFSADSTVILSVVNWSGRVSFLQWGGQLVITLARVAAILLSTHQHVSKP